MSCVQELYSQTLELGCRHKLALVIINDEILAGINQNEIFRPLDDQVDAILNIENKRRGPIHDVVHIALSGGADYQMVVLHAHINYSLSEV